jgi:hypothetical protein
MFWASARTGMSTTVKNDPITFAVGTCMAESAGRDAINGFSTLYEDLTMNRVAIASLALALSCLNSTALKAAEPANTGVSESNLSAMGLPGLSVLSDEQGTKVRGMGSVTTGNGFALSFLLGLGASHNNYASSGGLFSHGTNGSGAGFGIGGGGSLFGAGGGTFGGIGSFGGGGSTGIGF